MINPVPLNFVQTSKNHYINPNWITSVTKGHGDDYVLALVQPVVKYDNTIGLRYNDIYCKEDDLKKYGINLIA